jgi:ankyrin repeat protein
MVNQLVIGDVGAESAWRLVLIVRLHLYSQLSQIRYFRHTMDPGINKKIFFNDADLSDFFRDLLGNLQTGDFEAQKIVAWIALRELGYCKADIAHYLGVTTFCIYRSVSVGKRPEVEVYIISFCTFCTNVPYCFLWTPLHYALRYQQPDLARLLINRGADINAQTTGNWTPLHFALYYKHLDIALLLIKKRVRTDILTYQNFSPLHYAAAKGNKELVGMLIDRSCDVNSFTIFKIAPLHYALRNEHPRIARLLIEKGADINLAKNENWTPFHYALGNHLPDIAIELIHKGADVNAITKEGWTPLHFASSFDEYIDVVKLLLEKGADPKASLPDGDTPLSFAKARKAKKVEKLPKQYL